MQEVELLQLRSACRRGPEPEVFDYEGKQELEGLATLPQSNVAHTAMEVNAPAQLGVGVASKDWVGKGSVREVTHWGHAILHRKCWKCVSAGWERTHRKSRCALARTLATCLYRLS